MEKRKEDNRRKREASRAKKTEKAKRKKVQPPPQEDLDESDEDEEYNDDDDEINPNKCPKCSKMYDGNENQWVGCETCDRWFHKWCTDIEGANKMSNSELNELEWLCEYCTEE